MLAGQALELDALGGGADDADVHVTRALDAGARIARLRSLPPRALRLLDEDVGVVAENVRDKERRPFLIVMEPAPG